MRILALAVLLLLLQGCFWRGKKQQPQAATPPPPKPAPQIQPVPPPPKIETAPPSAPSPGVFGKLPEVPKPPESKPVSRRRPKPNRPVVKEKLPPPDPGSSAAPPPAPRLGEMLTETQRADLGRLYDDTLRRVNTGLAGVRGKSLSQEDKDTLERVRAFVRQAEQTRGRDPQSALQLAQRAEVLLADVLKSVR